MHNMEKLKAMLSDELDKIAARGEISSGTLDTAHKLTDTIKNIDKILMLGEVSDLGEYSERKSYYRGNAYHDGGNSYRTRRDSMGRYASDDGVSSYRDRGYSRDEAKSHIMRQIEDLMDGATEKERQVLQRAMTSLDNA